MDHRCGPVDHGRVSRFYRADSRPIERQIAWKNDKENVSVDKNNRIRNSVVCNARLNDGNGRSRVLKTPTPSERFRNRKTDRWPTYPEFSPAHSTRALKNYRRLATAPERT